MKKLIIYIHGFASSGFGNKALLFKECFKKERYLNPSLSHIPQLAIATLENLIETFRDDHEVCLMGSSLGGFYALYLSRKYHLKTVLINPAVQAFDTLLKYEGLNQNFYDASRFEMLASHLKFLQTLQIDSFEDQENILLMLQKGDEVLDYRDALNLLGDAELILEEGGDHGFQNILSHCESIAGFFKAAL